MNAAKNGNNLDERLFKYLKDKAMVNHNESIHVTHQEIAQDLHTSRVVISRLLKTLEIDGKIELHRNNIKVIDLENVTFVTKIISNSL